MMRVRLLVVLIAGVLGIALPATGQIQSSAEFNSSFRQGFQSFQSGMSTPSSGFSGFGSQSAIAGASGRPRGSANPLAVKGVSLSTRGRNTAGGGRIGTQKMPMTFSGLLQPGKARRQFGGAKVGRMMATEKRLGVMQPVFKGSSGLGSAIDFTQGIGRTAGTKSVFEGKGLATKESMLLSGRGGSRGTGLGSRKSFLTSGTKLGASRGNPFTSTGIGGAGGAAYNFLK